MSQTSPLDRIHKVYKSKINSHNLSSYAFHNKQKKIEEQEQVESELSLESLEISPEKLKAKRDLNYNNNIMHTFTGDASKFLGDGQYRIRFSAKSVEVDSY